MRIITTKGEFLVRGNWTVKQLREQFASFTKKYKSAMTFEQWLVDRGKVYFKFKS